MNRPALMHRKISKVAAAQAAQGTPRITLFALPKPFTAPQTKLIQTNAIASWLRLRPWVEVILLGDEPGLAEFAADRGIRHCPEIRKNRFGTPLLSDAFRRAHEWAQTPYLMYCNSDVILTDDLLRCVDRLEADGRFQRFLAFGRRDDLRVSKLVDFSDPQEADQFFAEHKRLGSAAPVVCKEYFLFSQDLYREIPDFAVGRGNWDNWMVHHARELEVPVINTTSAISAIHQIHDYQHLNTSRLGCYVTCPEARENERLAGGRNLQRGSCGTWRMTDRGVHRSFGSRWNLDFWRDLPRFMRFVIRLPFER